MSDPTEDEDRVRVPQRINLRSHVDRQPCHHGDDEYHAQRHKRSSNEAPAPRIAVRMTTPIRVMPCSNPRDGLAQA
jgi:hypothetical protein